MKQIIVLLICLAIGIGIGASIKKQPIIISDSDSLIAGWKQTQAELMAANAMLLEWQGKHHIAANTIARLKAQIAAYSAGGISSPDTIKGNGWRLYNDGILLASYCSDTLNYSLVERTIDIAVVEGKNNIWSATAYDNLLKKEAIIGDLRVQRNRDFDPPKPWYRRLATGAKYVGVAVVAGGAGYLLGRGLK